MVELRFLIVELRYLGVDWDCLKISYDFKENLKIDFHQGHYRKYHFLIHHHCHSQLKIIEKLRPYDK